MTGSGKLLPLSHAASVLSSSPTDLWQGISAQQYSLQPTECATHVSSSYSIVLQLSPPVTVEWQGQGHLCKRQLNPGDISVHTVGDRPGFRLHQPVEIFEVVLMPQFIHQVLCCTKNTTSIELIDSYGIVDPQIQRIATALKVELEMGCPGGQLLGESLATALAVHLLTQYGTHRLIASELSGGLSSSDLQRVIAFIHDNLSHNLTLSDLAAIANLSPHHFALRFKQSSGFSPHQYVIRQRIEKAKSLLLNSNASIADVACTVGFTNHSHLNLHFKRLVGVTPSQYRRG